MNTNWKSILVPLERGFKRRQRRRSLRVRPFAFILCRPCADPVVWSIGAGLAEHNSKFTEKPKRPSFKDSNPEPKERDVRFFLIRFHSCPYSITDARLNNNNRRYAVYRSPVYLERRNDARSPRRTTSTTTKRGGRIRRRKLRLARRCDRRRRRRDQRK